MQDYSRCLRNYKPGCDGLLLSNTLGDRSRDKKISEPFLKNEIAAGKAGGKVEVLSGTGKALFAQGVLSVSLTKARSHLLVRLVFAAK